MSRVRVSGSIFDVTNVLCCLFSAFTKRKEVLASLHTPTQLCYITVQTPHFMKRSVMLHYSTL